MTSLVDGTRVSKCDERVEAYGTVDELVAFTALLRDELRADAALTHVIDELRRIEGTLMTASALLAAGEGGSAVLPALRREDTEFLEQRMDAMQSELEPVSGFTVAGGCREVSLCHVCRTVCRRAERASLRAAERWNIDRDVTVWLNRLSDYFYLLGRTVAKHFRVREEYWQP